jgi:3-deoxy-D-manno-octulosonic-acid transferase
MIEVAALGKPCCFGPYTANFAEVVELLTRHRAATVVVDTEDLIATLEFWMGDPESAHIMGRKAQQLIEAQRGSTERYVSVLLALLALKRPMLGR